MNALGIAGFTIAGVLLIALAALTAYVLLGKKKATAADELDSSETVGEDSDETDHKDNE